MSEEKVEKKPRKRRCDAGQPRGPKVSAPEPADRAPIHVRIVLKGATEPIEFGCADRTIENGFQVFFYPSERDRYRTTRREFAISEIREIEITEAERAIERQPRQVFDVRSQTAPLLPEEAPTSGPRIHTVRRPRGSVIDQLESSEGPIELKEVPGLVFGGHAG